MAVDLADVDVAGRAGAQRGHGAVEVLGDPQVLAQVVEGATRYQPEDLVRSGERLSGGVDGAVAADDHHEFGRQVAGALEALLDLRQRSAQQLHREPGCREPLGDVLGRQLAVEETAGGGVDDQRCGLM